MKMLSNHAVTKTDLTAIDEKQTEQIRILKIAAIVLAANIIILNIVIGVTLYILK